MAYSSHSRARLKLPGGQPGLGHFEKEAWRPNDAGVAVIEVGRNGVFGLCVAIPKLTAAMQCSRRQIEEFMEVLA